MLLIMFNNKSHTSKFFNFFSIYKTEFVGLDSVSTVLAIASENALI